MAEITASAASALLLSLATPQLRAILRAEDILRPYAIFLDFLDVVDADASIANALATRAGDVLRILHAAAVDVQHKLLGQGDGRMGMGEEESEFLEPKPLVHVRIKMFGFEDHAPRIGALRAGHVGRFVSLEGTVIRSGQANVMTSRSVFECTKCKSRLCVHADVASGGNVEVPRICEAGDCPNEKFRLVPEEGSVEDYQEIRVQEQLQQLDAGKMPASVSVVLLSDLVESCTTGDDVRISGVVAYRWGAMRPGVRFEAEIIVIANHVHVYNTKENLMELTPEMSDDFEAFWREHASSPMRGRNILLSSICPQIYGMFDVKLAVLLMLVGGVPREASAGRGEGSGGGGSNAAGSHIRGDIHLLIVGDPGTGKSQFLKYAARLCPRSVVTSGMGTTAAGLTVAAIKEGGEWSLEAGALVLADGGLCCIDEFDAINKSDQATIHEAMEQQTISVAKAGIVAQLSTRASVFGVMNPKGLYDQSQSVALNCSIGGPLLSRFDIILVLLDTKDPEWDAVVSDHILDGSQGAEESNALALRDENLDTWDIERLRCYIQYVRHRFKPRLSNIAERILSSYYQIQRSEQYRSAARTTIRLLENLIRLAQAHARLMARDQVTLMDAVCAVLVVESSMHTSKILSTNALHSTVPQNPEEEYASLERKVLDLVDIQLPNPFEDCEKENRRMGK